MLYVCTQYVLYRESKDSIELVFFLVMEIFPLHSPLEICMNLQFNRYR